jgi:methylenetetrahydrofolate reductase (NADPH)
VELCGARLPVEFVNKLDSFSDDESVTEYGIEYATKQCEALLKYGVPGIHFYTLNKVRSTAGIVRNLGLA